MKSARKLVAVDGASAPQPEEPEEDFGDLEGEVCDVTNMAGILCDMVEALVTQEPPVRSETHVFCSEVDRNKLSYAAHEVSTQLLALKDRFYRIYNVDLEQKRSAKGGAQ